MATRTKDSAPPSKEKRGTSPSNVKKSPISSKPASPGRASDPTAHVPNYLKPTASSGPDTSKQQGKKPVTSDAAPRQNLTRRRSFDVPPSFNSRTQKTRGSPSPTLRSSSFAVKSGGSSKPAQDKNAKGAKDVGKQRSLYARPVQKMKTIYVKKQVTENGSTTKEDVAITSEKDIDPNVHDVHEPEMEVHEPELVVADVEEEMETGEVNEEKHAELSVKDDHQEQVNVEKIEAEDEKDANIETIEPPKALENEHEALDVKAEEKPSIEETGIKQEELEHTASETNSVITDETVAENPDKEIDDKKEENIVATEAPAESKGAEVVQEVAEEKKNQPGFEKATFKQRVAVQPVAKKDSSLSNDVIEETASKLREQRKNKVKALAGAFETVISLQEP